MEEALESPVGNHGTRRSRTIHGLNSGHTYVFEVRACNGVGWSEWSPLSKGFQTTPPRKPEECQPPELDTATYSTVFIRWNKPHDNGSSLTEFVLRYGLDPAMEDYETV